MTALRIRFTVLDVGQGSGNLLETFTNTSDSPNKIILMDLGSERNNRRAAGGPSVDYVIRQLEAMSGTATIELLVLSHSDADHVNLIPPLLQHFKPDGSVGNKPALIIKQARYGGVYAKYKKSKKTDNVLDQIEKYMPDGESPMKFTYNESGFRVTGTPLPAPDALTTVDGVDVYTMIANAPKKYADAPAVGTKRGRGDAPMPTTPFETNTQSVVLLLDFSGTRYVVTGDATGSTCGSIRNIFTVPGNKAYLTNMQMLTIPHHGSETTGLDITGSGGFRRSTGIDNMQAFATMMAPKSITASAETVGTFKHPSSFLMQLFWASLGQGQYRDDLASPAGHWYTSYIRPADGYAVDSGTASARDIAWPTRDRWYCLRTDFNLFTNLYYSWWRTEIEFSFTTKHGAQSVFLPNSGTTKTTGLKFSFPANSNWPLGVAWQYTTLAAGTTTVQPIINRAGYPTIAASTRSAGAAPLFTAHARHAQRRTTRQRNTAHTRLNRARVLT